MTIAQSILAVCFWCSVAGVVYAYLGYPILICAFARAFGRTLVPPVAPDSQLPVVALLIAAHNEAEVIESRILNALSQNYPPDRLEVVIASDGSDDATEAICRRYEGRVRTLHFPGRQGKAGTLNTVIPLLDAPIIALSDANTCMDPDALRHLARWFSDPTIGAVCGRLILTDPRTGRNADGMYWRYETFLKRSESRLGGLLGANGAIYAFRREDFRPLPSGTLVDDFVLPLSVKLRTNCRIVYEADAIANEQPAPDLPGEFRRRTRIGAGVFHSLGHLWPLLSPRYGWTAFTFWSHKVLRWVCPLLLIIALFASVALSSHPIYRAALLAQALFYGLCILGGLLPAANQACRILRIFPLFAGMNLALLIGFARWMRGSHSGLWHRTPRIPDGRSAA